MNDKKVIWIINQYGSTPETGVGGRHYYIAKELAKKGYKVYEIAAATDHLFHTQPKIQDDITFEEVVDNFTFVWVKMPHYAQAHSKQRVINWFLFSWKIQKLSKLIKDKPDAILCSSPSLISFLGAQSLAKRYNARLVFEVRDIWPLTLCELGGFSPKHPFIRFMYWVEKKAYRESDRVVSNLKNSVEHMVQYGLKREKFTWISNGFSLDEVNQKASLDMEVLEQLPKDKFIVGYTGTVGIANSLDTLLQAAELVKDYEEIVFVIVGKGKEKEKLVAKSYESNLKNVIFINAIPKVQVQAMLSKFDVCFIGWKKDKLYRYGIAANKIFDYLYSGKPILHAYSGACDPIAESKSGVVVEAENPDSLVNGILTLYKKTEKERQIIGENGRKTALDQYEYEMLAQKMAKVLFDD